MKIAVNTRFLIKDSLEGVGYFLQETLMRITKDHPEHEFFFIFDRPYDTSFIYGPNVKAVVVGPPARHPLLWKLWYDIRIPAILKKHKVDVFVSCDGFCSLSTKIPQCVVVHDLSFLHDPSFVKRSHYLFYKRYTPKFLEKASSVATVSEFSKQDILKHYQINENKINVVFSAARKVFHPASEEDKTAIKNKYTEGKEYFVYTGAIHPRKNLVQLLKAFSVFKKRQRSNFKLVLAGRLAWKYETFSKNLQTYKYREDVIMTGYVSEDELVKITGGAYALIYPSLLEGFGVPVLEAMHCEVPVITTSGSAMQEIAKDAALYADAASYEDIADKMMMLYKDEELRRGIIQKGKRVAAEYSWDRTADLLWKSILKAVE